jgi:hypothetical protein
VRPVVVGDYYGDSGILILNGLLAGDRVVVNGMLKVQPGKPVSVVESQAATAKSQFTTFNHGHWMLVNRRLAPSPLAGEGWGEGVTASCLTQALPTSPPSPQPSPVKGEGA